MPNEVRVKEKLERALEDVPGMLTTAGIVPHVSTEAGSPADVLVNLAKDYDAAIVERPWLRLGLQEEPLAALEQSYATATEQIEEERRLEKELWSEAEQIIRGIARSSG